jgi:hypothetical protein
MSLNGMSGTYYDYIKANSSSIISGATWNKIVHMVFMLVLLSLYLVVLLTLVLLQVH